MKKLLFIFLIPVCLLGQQAPPPAPAPASTPTKSPAQDFGNTQNNIMGAQARSFGGGSIIKPNPVLTSADFSFLQNPTYESGWRYGTGLGYSRVNAGKGFGANVILTFDLSQQTYSTFYRNGDWYYHFNFGRMGLARNTGLSVTRTWEFRKTTTGVQLGMSSVESKDMSNAYYVSVPYLVFLADREVLLNTKLEWKPEIFITVCSPYYDMGKDFISNSNTFNAVVGNNISFALHKKFRLNINWRANINTTPKFGVMNNILIGTNLKF